eukprot:TRINITY_DN64055_c0_g1_i1.p1 TRINITY_DN64055_c0_g1~~TRINITY_DN64055_c0_g1_i1.p1  ORF type:complete len:479 (-),score=61.24 TRINITY_DN64055_c0_g1_i1:238-1632(-)
MASQCSPLQKYSFPSQCDKRMETLEGHEDSESEQSDVLLFRNPKRWARHGLLCKLCLFIAVLILSFMLVVVWSILQIRPVWPLRALIENSCQPMSPEGPPPHVRQPITFVPVPSHSAVHGLFGLNLPPQQGKSFDGNFLGPGTGSPNADGSYNYEYTDEQLEFVRMHFGGIRLGFNIYTARNPEAVARIKHYFDVMRGGVNILAMWDTFEPWEMCTPLHTHGNGRVNDVNEAIAAWRAMFEALQEQKDIMFEVFNEPFGYWTVSGYLEEMLQIVDGAGLPHERVIVSGMLRFPEIVGMGHGKPWFGARGDDPSSESPHLTELSSLGWKGAFSYHQYPMTIEPGRRSIDDYAQKLLLQVGPVIKDHKIHFTEIGACLRKGDTVDPITGEVQNESMRADVPSLLGFLTGLRKLRERGHDIASAHWWFGMGGYVNDEYNVFDHTNNRSWLVERLAREINGNSEVQAA